MGVGVPPGYCYCFSFVLPNRGHLTNPTDEGGDGYNDFETHKI
jgi:hypothetical protein